MHDVNWWLMALAFLLGLLLTLAMMIRRVTREVPVTHTVSASVKTPQAGKPDLKAELGKVAGTVTAAGTAAAAGVSATLSDAADKVGDTADKVIDAVGGKIDAASDAWDVTARKAGDALDTAAAKADAALAAGAAAVDAKLDAADARLDAVDATLAAGAAAVDAKLDAADAKLAAGAATMDAKIDAVSGTIAAKFAAIEDVPAGPYGLGSAQANADGTGPAGWTIKGNADSMLYHATESPWYAQTIAEVWFADEESARKAGFLRWDSGKVAVAAIADVPAGPHGKGSAAPGSDGSGPAGWLIKGNADSMLFHGPDSPAYEQTIAEVWFVDEATARAAGFDRWDKNFT